MLQSVDCVVSSATNAIYGSSKTWLEVLMACLRHPLDQDAFMSTRQQVGTLSRKAKTQNFQCVPVENALCGTLTCQKIVPVNTNIF